MAIYGAQPYGPGTAPVTASASKPALFDPGSSAQQGSRRIDPHTGDYVVDATTGAPVGMTNTQQLVVMAIATQKRSSVISELGNDLKSIDRITDDIKLRVDSVYRAALAHLEERGLIVVTAVITERGARRETIAILVRFKDLTTGRDSHVLFGDQEG